MLLSVSLEYHYTITVDFLIYFRNKLEEKDICLFQWDYFCDWLFNRFARSLAMFPQHLPNRCLEQYLSQSLRLVGARFPETRN